MFFQEIYHWAGLRYHDSFALIFALNVAVGAAFIVLLGIFLRFISFLLRRYFTSKDTHTLPNEDEGSSRDVPYMIQEDDDSVGKKKRTKFACLFSSVATVTSSILTTIASGLFIITILVLSIIPAVFYGLHLLAVGSTIFAIFFFYAICIILLGIRWSHQKKVKTDDPEGHINTLNRTNRIKILLNRHKTLFALLSLGALLLSFSIPLAFTDTCICIFTKAHGISIMNGTAVLSTRLLRSFQIEKQCNPGPPCHVYATLPADTSTGVFINVHADFDVNSIVVNYDTLENFETTGTTGFSEKSYSYKLDVEQRGKRSVHSVLLHDLTPETIYYYEVFYDGKAQYNSTYKTLPAFGSHSPLTLVLGGDVGSSDIGAAVTKSLEKTGVPGALVIGGDAAYDDALQACWYSWDLFLAGFEAFNQNVNRTIPLILSVGNHDIGWNALAMVKVDPEEMPLYYVFFPQHLKVDENGNEVKAVPPIEERKTSFFQLIGNTMQLSLDSGYVETYESQAEWLNKLLPNYEKYSKFANYHVPMYPACRQLEDFPPEYRKIAIDNFVPVFEKFGFKAIFENHVHLFKKTFPLRNSKVDHENGIVYYGDGNWGVTPNVCLDVLHDLNNDTHVLEVANPTRHVWILNLTADNFYIYPVNASGEQFYPADTGTYTAKQLNYDL